MSRALWPLLLLWASGCATFDPADVPAGEDYLVLVKSCRLPPPVYFPANQAHHSWFDLKRGSEEDWLRLEVLTTEPVVHDRQVVRAWPISGDEARATERWERGVHLHALVAGQEARRIADDLLRQAARYEDGREYRAWPGPNSNTFVARLGRHTAGLRFELHHDAVSKDFCWARAGPTPSGTGLALETWLLGLTLGLEEGVELHLLQFTLGLDLFPPALKLPFLPRLGFPDTTAFD